MLKKEITLLSYVDLACSAVLEVFLKLSNLFKTSKHLQIFIWYCWPSADSDRYNLHFGEVFYFQQHTDFSRITFIFVRRQAAAWGLEAALLQYLIKVEIPSLYLLFLFPPRKVRGKKKSSQTIRHNSSFTEFSGVSCLPNEVPVLRKHFPESSLYSVSFPKAQMPGIR